MILDLEHFVTDNFPSDYTGEFHIGQRSDGAEKFNGKIDDIHIWNTPLTQEEIQFYMVTPPTGDESGLAGYWNFNAGSGDTLYDHSGNGNHGTIEGAQWAGCTDPLAENFLANAEVDDGSCEYPDNGDYSLSFDGMNNHVNISNLEGIELENFTYVVKFLKYGATGDNQCILNTQNGMIWIPLYDETMLRASHILNS